MRKTALLLSLVACVALAGSLLLAQDAAPKTGGDKVVKEGKAGGDIAKVTMTDAEKAQAKAEKAEKAKLGDIGAKMDKIIGGFSDDQKAKVIDLNKAREEALKKINDKFTADAVALLADEQKAKWKEATKEVKKGDKGAVKAGASDTGVSKEGGDAAK
jgi:hypothetical protein